MKTRKEQRTERMQTIAATIETLLHDSNPRTVTEDITIRYIVPTESTMPVFTDWERTYNHILPGEEYFIIREKDFVLYVVNVSDDSDLTAAEELIRKVAAKF